MTSSDWLILGHVCLPEPIPVSHLLIGHPEPTSGNSGREGDASRCLGMVSRELAAGCLVNSTLLRASWRKNAVGCG